MSRNHDQCDGCTDQLWNADAMPARSTRIPSTILVASGRRTQGYVPLKARSSCQRLL